MGELAALARDQLLKEPYSGAVYVFRAKRAGRACQARSLADGLSVSFGRKLRSTFFARLGVALSHDLWRLPVDEGINHGSIRRFCDLNIESNCFRTSLDAF